MGIYTAGLDESVGETLSSLTTILLNEHLQVLSTSDRLTVIYGTGNGTGDVDK